jgi:hypothetical protein
MTFSSTKPPDTAAPQAAIPIYYIHSLARPFCPLPGCWYKKSKQEVTALMQEIRNGEMTVLPAAPLLNNQSA